MNPLRRLAQSEQSIWLDGISRGFIKDGTLRRLSDEDGVTGLISNPGSLAKAIVESRDYDFALDAVLRVNPHVVNRLLAERLIVEDAQLAAAVLRPIYDRTNAADGFVSIAVSPAYAHDTAALVAEARRLWFEVARLNVMIAIPATPAAVLAVELLVAQGINVNVTLTLSLEQYEVFAHAYARGLARRAEPCHVTSVAVSAVDRLVERRLAALGTPGALALRGTIAVANARRIYRRFEELVRGDAFKGAARRGARAQRPVWMITGTGRSRSDVLHLEALAAPDTVAAIPTATLDVFRDHGRVHAPVAANALDDDTALTAAAALGLDIAAMAEQVQADELAALAAAHDHLLMTIDRKRQMMTATTLSHAPVAVP
jgi:transaldolase